MAADKIRHLRARRLASGLTGWYWIPSATIRALGLCPEALGETPGHTPSPAMIRRAVELNQLADDVRIGRRTRGDAGPRPGTIAFLVREYRGLSTKPETASPRWRALKERTRRDYAVWLDELVEEFGDLAIAAITPPVLAVWRDRLAEERGAYAAYHMLGVMRALFAWAVEYGHVETSPARGVEINRPPRRRVRWTLEERAAFVRAAFAAEEYGIAVAFLLADCVAQSPVDVWSLTVGDFDGARITRAARRKREADDREHPPLPLWPHVAQALSWYLERRAADGIALHPDAPLFVPEGTQAPWRESTRHKRFQELREAAGLAEHLQWQDLRRTGATEAGEAGAEAAEIKGLLRHSSLSEASTYTLSTARGVASAQAKRLAARERKLDES